MASSTSRKDSSSSSSSSMPMSPGLRAPHNDSSLHPPRPKSPMTFGLRRLRQPSLSSSSAIDSAGPSSPSTQAHPSSPRTPASTQSSPTTTRATGKTGGLFRRPSFSQLTSSKLSNGSGNRGATSSSSPSPASPNSSSASPSSKIPRSTPRPSSRGQHTRTPSSSNTSSILSNASTAQQELNAAAHPHNRAPDPSRRSFSLDPVPASAKRKVYGREDVERYRAAGHEPHRSISQGTSAITTTTQDPSAAAADTNPRRYEPPPPTSSSSSSQQSAAAASSQQMPSSSTSSSSLGRNGTLKASSRFNAAPAAASPSASQSTSVRSSIDHEAVESLDSQRGGSSRPTSRPPSIYERSQSVLGVRSGSGHEPSHARSQSSLRSFGMNRSDSNGSRRSIFGWGGGGGGSSGSSNANQPNNKKLAPTSHAHSHSRTPSTSSALKATTLEFLRSASALGHRNDRNRRADSDDSDSDSDDERTMGSKTPEPGFFSNRGAGGHGRKPSGTSGIPLFRRNRATSQSTAAALGSGQGQQPQDLPPRAPSRSSTMASSVLGGGVGGGGGGFLSALSKVKSREGVRATEPQGSSTRQTPPRAAAQDDDDKDLPPRPSTSIGHYLSTPTRTRRPSQASISPEASFTARRKRIPSIYSLAPGVMGGSGGGQSESDLDAAAAAAPGTPTSPASAGAPNGANGGTGWRFGRGWMRGRKDTKSSAGVASVDPFNSGNSAATGSGSNQALPLLSPNANSATRKWVALPEPTGSTASLHGTAPSLIFGVPLRDAVIRTRFISPVPLGEESSAAAAASEQAKKEPLSPLRARRRPSKIGLLDLGTEFSISPDLFGATGGSASASSIDSAFSLPSPASPASSSVASPTVSSPARVPVDRATARKQYLPRFVVRCIESLETYGPEEEGVYRLSGRTSHTQRIRHLFDGKMDLSTLVVPLDDGEEQGSAGGGGSAGDGDFDCDLDLRALPPSECDLNSVCSALKAYLRELPAPILSKDRLAQLEGIVRRFQQEQQRQTSSGSGNGNAHAHLEEASHLLSDLPPAPWYLLRELCLHLGDLTHPTVVSRTKMTLNNLCLVLAPTLFIPVTTLNFLVQQREELFRGPPREDAQLDGVREGGILGGFGSGTVGAGAGLSSTSSSVAGTPSRSTTARQTPTPTTPSMIPISSARNSPRKPTAAAHTRTAGSSGSSSADAAYSSPLPHRRDPSNSRLGATDGSATNAKHWRETVFLGLPASSGGLASDWGAALAAAGNHRDSHASVSTVTAGNQGGQDDLGGDVTARSGNGEGNDSTDADLTMVIKPHPATSSSDEDDDATRQQSGSGSGEDLSSSMSTTNTTRSTSSAQSSLANLSSRESHSRHSSTNTAISSLLGPSVSANGIGGQQLANGAGSSGGAAPPLPLLSSATKQNDATPTKGSEPLLTTSHGSVEHSHDKEVLLDDDAQSTTTATTPSAATTPPVSRHNREQSNSSSSNGGGSVRSFGSNKDVPAPPVPGKDELLLSRRRPSAASVTTTPSAATPSYLAEGSTPVSRARSRTHEGSTAPPPSAYTAPSAAAMTPSSSSSGSASGSSIYNRFATPMSGSSSSVNQYPYQYQPPTTITSTGGSKGQALDVPTSSSSCSSTSTTTATPASPAISSSASHSSLKSSGSSSTTTSTLDRPRPIASSSSPSAGGGAGVSGRFFSWGGGRD